MQISFYEEFPSEKNLKKLNLIKSQVKLFVAADSVKNFKKLEKQVKKIKNNVEVAYWPIIPNSYWISLFSNTKDLTKTFRDLEKIKNPLLIDLELPKNKKLIIKNIFSFFRNKRLIKKFLEKNKNRITTAEPVEILFSKWIRLRGQDFNIKTKKSLMWYSSMVPKFMNRDIRKNLKNIKNKKQYSISLGAIATGILGNEKILSPKKLEKDIEFVKKLGFEKVIIFRLGGLNKKYVKVINKFQTNG